MIGIFFETTSCVTALQSFLPYYYKSTCLKIVVKVKQQFNYNHKAYYIMKTSFTFLSAIIFPGIVLGQGLTNKPFSEYKNYGYSIVIENNDEDKAVLEAQRKAAENYKLTGNYNLAEKMYAKLNESSQKAEEDIYAYAQILKMNKKYAEAQQQMILYSSLKSSEIRAKLFNENKTYFNDLLKDKGQFKIKNLEANSAQQDFGVTYYKEKVVFASSRCNRFNATLHNWKGNNLPYLDLFVGEVNTENEITETKKIGKFNKKYHEGPATYTKDGNTVMYTEDNYKEKSSDHVRKLVIMESKYQNGKWGEKKSFPLNNKEYSVGHPSLSSDGNTLYFASDMPGGKGGVDIYRITRNEDGSWGTPENLGDQINTEGNEMFPFIHESGLFFFSSDGRPGLGGLDVFATEIKNNKINKVINVGAPVNGSKDDFTFVLNSDKTNGYFASNREGGKGFDDIYSFNLLKPFIFSKTIKGTAKDKEGRLLANTKVNLYDALGNIVNTISTTENATYSFEIENNGIYKLVGIKDSYFEGNNSVNITDNSDVMLADVVLEKDPGLSLIALITDAASSLPLEGVKINLFNIQSNTQIGNYNTPETGDFKTLLTTNKIGDKIAYKLKLEKTGYITKEVVFSYEIVKPGEIKIHETLDLSMAKLKVGEDLATMIDVKPIYFDLGKWNIRKDATKELDKIVKIMNEHPNMVIELGSHTDCRGTAASNEKLSNKRAVASANYIKKWITNPERIYGKGYGESKLKNGCACEGNVKTNYTEAQHQENRRTEFIIIKVD